MLYSQLKAQACKTRTFLGVGGRGYGLKLQKNLRLYWIQFLHFWKFSGIYLMIPESSVSYTVLFYYRIFNYYQKYLHVHFLFSKTCLPADGLCNLYFTDPYKQFTLCCSNYLDHLPLVFKIITHSRQDLVTFFVLSVLKFGL